MKKLLPLLAGGLLLSATSATAQFNYNFSVQTGQTYTPMTTANVFSDTDSYNDLIFIWIPSVSIPYDRQSMDTVWLMFENLVSNRFFDTDVSPAAAFQFTNADLTDKAFFDTVNSLSPVRFDLTGTAPNRILKFELTNMGFVAEHDTFGTLNDYANIQYWAYETSGVVELRYGPSQISHFSTYFPEGAMAVGLYHDLDFLNGGGTFYYLSGNPSAPTIDSLPADEPAPSNGLSAWPADGTVYRFAPKPLAVARTAAPAMKLTAFPSTPQTVLNVDYGDDADAAFSVVSAQGAVALRGQLTRGRNTLDVSSLPAGSYIFMAKNAGGTGLFRFVKQ